MMSAGCLESFILWSQVGDLLLESQSQRVGEGRVDRERQGEGNTEKDVCSEGSAHTIVEKSHDLPTRKLEAPGTAGRTLRQAHSPRGPGQPTCKP